MIYKVLIEFTDNNFEEKIIASNASAGTLCDKILCQDRIGKIRSVEANPLKSLGE
jgi:hypothetical protein